MSPERKVLGLLAVSLLVWEGAVRIAEPLLSKDLAHLRGLAALPERLPPGGGGVLVLGNSLARCGIDGAALSQGIEGHPEVAFMVPDATSVIEWAWGYRRHVLHAGARPALVVLMTGRTHLLDAETVQVSRLGAFHVGGAGDRREFLTRELSRFEDRAVFLLSGVSRLYADRGRIQPLLFYRFVPGYETSVNRINQAAGGGVVAGGDEETGRGLRHLHRLIDSVRESGARLVVVTAPLPEPWSLAGPVAESLREHSVPVVALGAELILPPERFPDGYHLDPEGASLATAALVEALQWQPRPDGGRKGDR